MGFWDLLSNINYSFSKENKNAKLLIHENTKLLIHDVINAIEENAPDFKVISADAQHISCLTIVTNSGTLKYYFREHNFAVSKSALSQLMCALEKHFHSYLHINQRDVSEDSGLISMHIMSYVLFSSDEYVNYKNNINQIRRC